MVKDQNPFTRGGVVRNDFNRNKNQSRIGNRVDVGQVKKVMIYRNGDPQFKYKPNYSHIKKNNGDLDSCFRPKTYFYRTKLIRNNWEKLFEDLQKVAPPVHGGPISHLYDLNGREIDDMDEIEAGRSYVAAGIEGYKNVKNG